MPLLSQSTSVRVFTIETALHLSPFTQGRFAFSFFFLLLFNVRETAFVRRPFFLVHIWTREGERSSLRVREEEEEERAFFFPPLLRFPSLPLSPFSLGVGNPLREGRSRQQAFDIQFLPLFSPPPLPLPIGGRREKGERESVAINLAALKGKRRKEEQKGGEKRKDQGRERRSGGLWKKRGFKIPPEESGGTWGPPPPRATFNL